MMLNRRQLLSAVGATALVPALGTAMGATAHAAPPSATASPAWREVPTGLKSGLFYSVAGKGSELWAVGTLFTGPDADFTPLALRHSSAGWAPTVNPLPRSRLFDVAIVGAGDVWAVGEGTNPVQNSPLALVQHWNGQDWTETGPQVPDADQASLSAVATCGRSVWTAGWAYADSSQTWWPLVFRNDRGNWQQLADPVLGGPEFVFVQAVLPVAADVAWVGGFGGIARYAGGAWRNEPLPTKDDVVVSIQGLSRCGPEIWAVGHAEDPVLWRRPLVLRHDGRQWTELPTPAEPAQLWSLSFLNGKPVVVGEDHETGGPYVLTREGSGFARTNTPPHAGQLYGSTASNGRLWAAGRASDAEDPYLAGGSNRWSAPVRVAANSSGWDQ
jgi:hypothetical protein